jgi:hypothetical protein
MIGVIRNWPTELLALSMLFASARHLRAQRNESARPSSQNVAGDIPAGTRIEARLEHAIDAARDHVGDRFTARVTTASLAANRRIHVPPGAIITGTITGLHRAHTTLAPAFVRLAPESVSFGGQEHRMHAAVESTSLTTGGGQGAGAPMGGGAFPGITPGSVLVGLDADDGQQGSLISLGTDDASLRLPRGTLLHLRVN